MIRLTKQELLHYWSFQEKCNQVKDYKEYISVSHTGDHLCVFQDGDELIVSIDATEGKREWAGNFNFNPPIKGFHRDFFSVGTSFSLQLRAVLANLTENTSPITCIGHSRGGGIAPILNKLIIDLGYTNTKTITFAAPRCSTLKGRRTLAKAGVIHHRCEAKFDVVDNVPPRVTLFPLNIWKHHTTFEYELPSVKGLDHANIGAALKEYANG